MEEWIKIMLFEFCIMRINYVYLATDFLFRFSHTMFTDVKCALECNANRCFLLAKTKTCFVNNMHYYFLTVEIPKLKKKRFCRNPV